MNKEKDKFRIVITQSITWIFTLNAIIIIIYCSFFFNKSVATNINKTKKNVDSIFNEIGNEITLDNIESLSKKYNVELCLVDLNNKVIFNNFYDSNFKHFNSKIIEINNKKYLLKIGKQFDIDVNKLIAQILYVELGIILFITIICYKILSKKLLIPIYNLRKDMLAYKTGTIPTRREKNTSIDELQNNFIDLTEALELEKEKQNQIIASISHDIKTPLTSIMGYSKRLETAVLSDEKKIEYIKKINSQTIVMRDIINEFDDFLGCNLNQNLNFEKIYIKELLSSIKNDFEEDLKEKGIKLKIKNRTNKEDFVVIDLTKIKRIFNNTISNSIRYLYEQPKKEINIIVEKKEGYIQFEVADNGTGVDKNLIDKIFDPLFTTDASRKISGLGLSICKEIALLHKGNIRAKNNSIGGLSIIFTIKIDY